MLLILLSRLTKAHTGEYLAEKTATCQTEYGLTNSVLSMALDNASNNTTMLQELPLLLPPDATVGTTYQIRCFGHIINLSVKAFLSLFDSSAKAIKADEKPKEDEEDETDEDVPESDSEEFEEDEEDERDTGDWDEIARLTHSLSEVAELDAEDKVVGRTTMKKVCLSFPSLFLTF